MHDTYHRAQSTTIFSDTWILLHHWHYTSKHTIKQFLDQSMNITLTRETFSRTKELITPGTFFLNVDLTNVTYHFQNGPCTLPRLTTRRTTSSLRAEKTDDLVADVAINTTKRRNTISVFFLCAHVNEVKQVSCSSFAIIY